MKGVHHGEAKTQGFLILTFIITAVCVYAIHLLSLHSNSDGIITVTQLYLLMMGLNSTGFYGGNVGEHFANKKIVKT